MKNKKKYCVLIVFGLLVVVKNLPAQGIDARILEAINPQYPTSKYWKYTSTSAYVLSAIGTTELFVRGQISGDPEVQHTSYEVLIAMGLNLTFMETLKVTINRERPGDRYPNLIFPSSPVHGQSFPSGHTLIAFNTAAELTIKYRKWYIAVPAYLWAGSVGYSRMYLGKHYPSDVLGGAVTGIGTAYLGVWLNHKLFRSYYKHE